MSQCSNFGRQNNTKTYIHYAVCFYFSINTSYAGSNHHACALQRNRHVIPNDAVPCLNSRFMIKTVKIIVKTVKKPPSCLMLHSTTFIPSVIVLIFRRKFHSIMVREAISYNKVILKFTQF